MTLRQTLLGLLIAIPVLPGCVSPGCDNLPEPESGTVELMEPVDPELQALVDDCRAAGGSGQACEPMCIELIERELGERPTSELTECSLFDDQLADTTTAEWGFGARCVGGRRPACYAPSARVAMDRVVGAYFAEQARLEAASVRAFLELANALAHHHAPRVLIQACRRAAAEEITHAVMVGRLAVRHGVTPQFHAAPAAPIPTLEQLAHANAIEGCMRETWGAMVATWQGHTARDPEVRAVMRRIAIEETRHATLSRAIDRWAMRKLDAAARARIVAARAIAFVELAAAVTGEIPEALVQVGGLPSRETGATLIAAMHASGALG